MNFTYFLYILTFWVYPLIGIILFKIQPPQRYFQPNKIIITLFIAHIILFFLGFSIKGDYPDDIVFSIEYLYFILILIGLYRKTDKLSTLVRNFGKIILVIGFLQGIIGLYIFAVISQDFEADKTFQSEYNGNNYETRRYSFGFATLTDTRYTFVTYLNITFLPIEKQIDETVFFGLKSQLDFENPNFEIRLTESQNTLQIQFSSSMDNIYTKSL